MNTDKFVPQPPSMILFVRTEIHPIFFRRKIIFEFFENLLNKYGPTIPKQTPITDYKDCFGKTKSLIHRYQFTWNRSGMLTDGTKIFDGIVTLIIIAHLQVILGKCGKCHIFLFLFEKHATSLQIVNHFQIQNSVVKQIEIIHFGAFTWICVFLSQINNNRLIFRNDFFKFYG